VSLQYSIYNILIVCFDLPLWCFRNPINHTRYQVRPTRIRWTRRFWGTCLTRWIMVYCLWVWHNGGKEENTELEEKLVPLVFFH